MMLMVASFGLERLESLNTSLSLPMFCNQCLILNHVVPKGFIVSLLLFHCHDNSLGDQQHAQMNLTQG